MLIEGLVNMPGTLLHRKLAGDDWALDQHLLALVHDQLAVANWQRSKDGAKNRNRPKPLSPLAAKGHTTHYGKTDRSPEEVKAYLARFGPPPS